MEMDIGSNFTVADGLPALLRTGDTYYTASVDHKNGSGASFHVSCGTYETSFIATVQHSSDDGSSDTYIDEVTGAGNDVSVELSEAGSGNLEVPNPRERYSRVKLVVGGTTTVCGVTSILGPLRTVS